MRRFIFLLLPVIAGCKVGPIPDPNDPDMAGANRIEVLQRNLGWAYSALQERVNKGEISVADQHRLIRLKADKLLENVDPRRLRPQDAWRFGDVFRTAQRWEDARKAYEVAVSTAQSEDRRVNDNLRLAQCLAKLGRIDEAISRARSAFKTPPAERAPILPAVLYEVVPAAQGKGNDGKLARLLEEAMREHQTTQIDVNSQAGRAFLTAFPHHLLLGWKKVLELYRSAGQRGQEAAARKRAMIAFPNGFSEPVRV